MRAEERKRCEQFSVFNECSTKTIMLLFLLNEPMNIVSGAYIPSYDYCINEPTIIFCFYLFFVGNTSFYFFSLNNHELAYVNGKVVSFCFYLWFFLLSVKLRFVQVLLERRPLWI